MVKNGKRFDFVTPEKNLIPPKRPVLNKHDIGELNPLFDIRLATDIQINCDAITQSKFEKYKDEQDRNAYIKLEQGAINFLNGAFDPEKFMAILELFGSFQERESLLI